MNQLIDYAPPTLLVLLLILCLLDTYSTWENIRMGAQEENPLMQKLIGWLGLEVALLVPRGLLLVVLGWAVFFSGADVAGLIPWLAAACVVYVVVVYRFRAYRAWRNR